MRYLSGSSTSNKYWYGQTAAGPTADTPNLSSAILMKNSSAGYAYTLTARIQKTYRNFFFSVAYTYSQAKNIAAGGSTASSLWSGRPVGNADPNGANLAYADYYQPHRIIAYASYKVAYSASILQRRWALYFRQLLPVLAHIRTETILTETEIRAMT